MIWTFIEQRDGILFFEKDSMTRNTVGELVDVETLIALWEAEDAAANEQGTE